MTKTADVVIIGAGVMGASIAFNLARRGVTKVAVLEKNFIAAGATGKSSACVRQHYSTEVGARMVLRSLEIFQNFSEIVGGSAGFVKTGYLMGVGERDYQALKKVIAMQHPMFYDFQHQFYSRPEGRDLTLIGTLNPAEVNDRIDPDVYNDGVNSEETSDVVAALCERFPSFETGHLHSGYSGPFDVTPDWHPIIDEAPGVRGFYLAVGFSGHGFKLSPAVGEMVAELVINGKQPGKRAESDVNTFRHSRFAEKQPVRGMYDEGLMG